MSTALRPDERRIERRYAVNMRAVIQAKRESPKIQCRVTDISASGAKLNVMDGDVPDDFVLCFNANGTVIRICKLVWREGTAIGVQFVDQKKSDRLRNYLIKI